MGAVDRTVRRASRLLDPFEGLVAALPGVEDHEGEPGRRRLVMVATDRRILIAMVRGGPITEIHHRDVEDVAVTVTTTGTRLQVSAGQTHVIHPTADRRQLELFVSLLEGRRGSRAGHDRPQRVRLVG